jgi:hypothetical protein
MVEDELITTRFVAFAGANDHPPAAFPNRDVWEHQLAALIQLQTGLEEKLHNGIIALPIMAAASPGARGHSHLFFSSI